MEELRGLVLIGEVIGAGRDRLGSTAWLRELVAELDAAYGERRLAPFGFLQGDELQGLLAAETDPLVAVLHAALGPTARPIRWVCVSGRVDPGEGPATERTGQAYTVAREAMKVARSGHDRLVMTTGRDDVDELLADMTPALADLLAGLTSRQRAVARLALLGGLRQSEVAERLGVRRATISVSFGRARIQSLTGLVAAIRRVHATQDRSADSTGNPRVATEPVVSASATAAAAVAIR
jgi:DNA-binding CsgD family transcriptional regulator